MIKKKKSIVKGAPSGFVISLLIHAAAFLLAGMLVVFNVVKKQEKKFVPPTPVERPKMKLKKPKVKVKKSAKPKSSSRIVTKVKRASMPDIQLPEMSGLGTGFAGGGLTDGFDIMPDMKAVSMFGGTTSIGNDLEGTLYDLKRFRNGRTSGIYETEGLQNVVEKFLRNNWRSSTLSQYYRAPKKLYSPMIMIPPTDSSLGPWAFGEREMDPWAFLLHYKGQLIHKDGMKFRFIVMADNYLVIRVNGKVVMDYKNQFESAISTGPFKPTSYHLGHWFAYRSEWIELEPGVPQDVEFILGDYKGYLFASMVAIEEEGVDYPNTPLPQDNPQLPVFKTARLSPDLVEAVEKQMWKGHINLTDGPIFSDYDTGGSSTNAIETAEEDATAAPLTTMLKKQPIRLWTLNSGKTVEAEYVTLIGGKVVIKTKRGKTVKTPASDFSEADQLYLTLLNPPKLKISFKKDTKQYPVKSNPELDVPVPVATDFAGRIVIEQESKKANYNRPLKVEFYVIADNYDGNDYILFDRQIEEFTLTPENERKFELTGRTDTMLRYEHYSGDVRGARPKGYMILVLNENNEIIAQNLSHDWLIDIRDKLAVFPIGRNFNKEGKRVSPPSPPFTDRYWDAEP